MRVWLTSWLAVVSTAVFAVNVDENPDQREWQYFMQGGAELRRGVWQEHVRRGYKFGDWSWGWRILWVKSCGVSKDKYCLQILSKGFNDPALVVRAETITQLGLRYRGSESLRILKKLQRAFLEKRNFRNKKPMFIHKNILLAMQRIGGQHGAKMRTELGKHLQ